MAYTDIDDPSVHFQTALYSGTGSTQSITNDGNSDMQPDWVWWKRRNAAYSHGLSDSSRGTNKYLRSDTTAAEDTYTGYITSFNSDGYTIGSGDQSSNNSSGTYAAWQWKANGGTTTSVSASGTGNHCINACTHQANTTAGFSIITYTGRDDQLNNAHESKLTHGLGVAPSVFICKRRDATDDWFYLGGKQSSNKNGWNNAFLSLNDTDAVNGNHYTSNNEPDATYIYLGNEKVNIASATYVGYAFAEVQGYSKFGSYVGNGNANGTFIYTGFKPAFIMVKTTALTDEWNMFDNRRSGFNVNNDALYASASYAEDAGSVSGFMDIVSNGFKLRRAANSPNRSTTYIYMAFAENPFTTSTGIPTTAR